MPKPKQNMLISLSRYFSLNSQFMAFFFWNVCPSLEISCSWFWGRGGTTNVASLPVCLHPCASPRWLELLFSRARYTGIPRGTWGGTGFPQQDCFPCRQPVRNPLLVFFLSTFLFFFLSHFSPCLWPLPGLRCHLVSRPGEGAGKRGGAGKRRAFLLFLGGIIP